MLDIVAKSIYTDKEVFLRELLSNSSDALEKQKFRELTGESASSAIEHRIDVTTNEKDRSISFFDSGVGMSREEAIANLGTIAKSGSKEFMQALMESDQGEDAQSSIIG